MTASAEKIVAEAMTLPTELRAFIAEKLIESLDESSEFPLSASWKEEVRRRCADIDHTVTPLRDANVVFRNAYASFERSISREFRNYPGDCGDAFAQGTQLLANKIKPGNQTVFKG
jgi:hypothetical protein